MPCIVPYRAILHANTMLQAIQDRYSSLDGISGPDFEVRFEGDIISLEVPEDGTYLPNGWSITPLVPPVVS